MIPQFQEALPALAVETVYEPAQQGADAGLFDTFTLDAGEVALVVGDGTAEGSAPVCTTEVRNVLRVFLGEHPYPARALSLLNDLVCDAASRGGQEGLGRMPLSLAVIDPSSWECELAVAGADRPLLLRADGEAETVAMEGPAIGAVPGFAYKTATRHIGPGDTLLMGTDAIIGGRDICLLVARRQ